MTKEKFLAIVLILFSFIACEEDVSTPTFKETYSTLYSFMEESEELSHFKSIVDNALIANSGQSMKSVYTSYNTYNGNNTFTLFLPDNDAVESYLLEKDMSLDGLLASAEDCWNIAANHLVLGPVYSKDFPNGALPELSLNNENHTMRYLEDADGVSFLINESASILSADYNVSNGIIHLIDRVLEPISYTACEWIRDNDEFTVFYEALLLTGLYDRLQESDVLALTLFIESDEVFNRVGVFSVDDLISKYSPTQSDYTNQLNPLYQFVAFHILKDKAVFVADMNDSTLATNYETYASYPISIKINQDYSDFDDLAVGIALNKGFAILDTIVDGVDTTLIDYVSIYETESNQPTLDGVIHSLNYVLDVDSTANASTVIFEFEEDPAILAARSGIANVYYSMSEDVLDRFVFGGDLNYIYYTISDDDGENARSKDWIMFDSFYEISYTTPRFMQGDYQLQLRVNARRISGLVDVYLDDKKVGPTVNLGSLSPPSGANPWLIYTVGTVAVQGYQEHVVTLKAVTPGAFCWDYVRFLPLDN